MSEVIPYAKVEVGGNYRRRYDADAMAALAQNIKDRGVLEPIITRCSDEGLVTPSGVSKLIKLADIRNGLYKVVAGSRRVMAAEIAFGLDGEIPATAKIMTDDEASAIMVSENHYREATSVIEDAEAAARILGELKGDKEETAKRFGWKVELLNRRLALMNAAAGVRDAFLDRKIQLGHVEILAAMRREVQEKVLAQMLGAGQVPTVEQLKRMAEAVLLSLDAAIFDKAECGSCQYNTGFQQAFFETSFDGVRCTDQECYGNKTEAELEKRREALQETYQVVRIVRPGENNTVTPLRAEGNKGVGEEQSKACRVCRDFGACVSAAPDKLGMTFKDVCFNPTCHSEKVEANAKAVKAAVKTSQQEHGGKPDASSSTTSAKPEAGKGQAGEESQGGKKAAKPEVRNAIKEYREKIWRLIFARAVPKLTVEQSRALLIALCLYRPSNLDTHSAAKAVAKALGMEGIDKSSAASMLELTLSLDQPQLGAALQQIPAWVREDMSINDISGMLQALDVKIEKYWRPRDGKDEVFFNLLTKTELVAVCEEIGIAQALGKEFAKLKSGSKADFVKGIASIEGFEYTGRIPQMMRW